MTRGPKVHVPSGTNGSQGGVQLGRVGIIAVVGFGIGVVWPRLAGVSLVPSAPVEGARQEALAVQDGSQALEEGQGDEAEAAVVERSPAERISVDEYKVTSCRDAQGKTISDCGKFDGQALLAGALQALVTCPAAENAVGKLSVGVDLDLKARRAGEPKSGRTTDLPAPVTQGLLSCVAQGLENVPWSKAEASHASYTVYALVEFKSPREAASAAIVPASGSAVVRWNVALIRKEPTTDGPVRARLTSGTRVIVTARQEEWYRVKYDTKGGEGWVHGAAIGMNTADGD